MPPAADTQALEAKKARFEAPEPNAAATAQQVAAAHIHAMVTLILRETKPAHSLGQPPHGYEQALQ